MLTRMRKITNLTEIPLAGLPHTEIQRQRFYVYKVDYDKGDSIIGTFKTPIEADKFIEHKNIFGGCIFTGQQVLERFIPSYAKYEDYIEETDDGYDIELFKT